MFQEFFSKTKLTILSLVIILVASVFFYIQFENFKPQEGVDLKEIGGTIIASNNSIPKPKDAEILGVSKSENTTQTTYETTKNPQEIHSFYKNILENEGWKLDLQETIDLSLQSKFSRENENITITASPQKNSEETVVSVSVVTK